MSHFSLCHSVKETILELADRCRHKPAPVSSLGQGLAGQALVFARAFAQTGEMWLGDLAAERHQKLADLQLDSLPIDHFYLGQLGCFYADAQVARLLNIQPLLDLKAEENAHQSYATRHPLRFAGIHVPIMLQLARLTQVAGWRKRAFAIANQLVATYHHHVQGACWLDSKADREPLYDAVAGSAGAALALFSVFSESKKKTHYHTAMLALDHLIDGYCPLGNGWRTARRHDLYAYCEGKREATLKLALRIGGNPLKEQQPPFENTWPFGSAGIALALSHIQRVVDRPDLIETLRLYLHSLKGKLPPAENLWLGIYLCDTLLTGAKGLKLKPLQEHAGSHLIAMANKRLESRAEPNPVWLGGELALIDALLRVDGGTDESLFQPLPPDTGALPLPANNLYRLRKLHVAKTLAENEASLTETLSSELNPEARVGQIAWEYYQRIRTRSSSTPNANDQRLIAQYQLQLQPYDQTRTYLESLTKRSSTAPLDQKLSWVEHVRLIKQETHLTLLYRVNQTIKTYELPHAYAFLWDGLFEGLMIANHFADQVILDVMNLLWREGLLIGREHSFEAFCRSLEALTAGKKAQHPARELRDYVTKLKVSFDEVKNLMGVGKEAFVSYQCDGLRSMGLRESG